MPCNWQVVRCRIKGRHRMLTHRRGRKRSVSKSANMFLTLLCNKHGDTCWHTQLMCSWFREIVQIWHLPKDILVSQPSVALMKCTVKNARTLAFCKTGFRNWTLLLVVHHTTVDTTSWHNCVITGIVMWCGYTSFAFTFKSHFRANTIRHVDKTFATCKSFRLEPTVMTESYGSATWT